MKTLQKYLTLLLMAAGFVSPVLAQRGDHHDGGFRGNNGGNRQSSSSFRDNSFSGRQNNAVSRPSGSFLGRQDRQTTFSQPRQSFQSMSRNNGNSFSSNPRFHDNNNSFVQRNNRVTYPSNLATLNSRFRGNSNGSIGRSDLGRRNYFNNNGYYNRYGGRYSYAPRRWVYGGYSHYSILPRTFVSISFGGYPYYYYNGLFYSYFDGFYEPVYAPFGICVSTLPYGYYPFYWQGIPYYYYDGVYYRNHGDDEYEVVDAPVGAVVSVLPKGAKSVTVNGEQFYEFNGTYYKQGTNDKDEVVYTVVGKNGQINNSTDPNVDSSSDQQAPLQIGDIVSTLPDNCTRVTINGQALYVSPDNLYFKERNDNGTVSYEVVGSGTDDNKQ